MQDITIKKNIALLNYTTIHIGGNTEFFSQPNTVDEFINLVIWAKENKYECRIIGAGSNLLINNRLLKGLTICTKKLRALKFNPDSGLLEADCGVMLPNISQLLAKYGFNEGDWQIGIPGTVGGAVFMNAGAGNYSIENNLYSVMVIDKEKLNIFELKKSEINFNYRYSSFQRSKLLILSAKFFFKSRGNSKTIMARTKANLRQRTESQPYNQPSFGSVFKNPKNDYAGKIIEESGLKGFQIGGAEVSKLHANFIINNSSATSKDVLNLISKIQEKVLQKKGIILKPEVRMMGF